MPLSMPYWWAALLVCLAYSWTAAGQNLIELTDDTFELATQASTGQTTGHWFVLFICPDKDSKNLEKVWGDLANDSWQQNFGFQVAEVNTCENELLAERFNGNATTLILFRDRKMYKYPLLSSQNSPPQKQTLHQFVTSEYQQTKPLAVPKPRSFTAGLWSAFAANMKELHELGFTSIALLIVGFIVAKFAVYIYLNERKVTKATTAQKKQS